MGCFARKETNWWLWVDAVGARTPPVIARLDLVLVEPDIVPALFQVDFDDADQHFVSVVPVAEKDAEWGVHKELNGDLFVLRYTRKPTVARNFTTMRKTRSNGPTSPRIRASSP